MAKIVRSYKDSQWSKSALTPKLGLMFVAIDYRAFIFVLLLLISPTANTFYLVVILFTFFCILQFLGFPLPIAISRAKANISGRYRYVGHSKLRRRRFRSGA